MTSAPTTCLRGRAHEIPASDGFGSLPPSTAAPRNRTFTRGLCTFLGWPFRRSNRPQLLCQPNLRRPASPALRVVNE